MRNITDHKVNGLNEAIVIKAVDAPGAGGANHHYTVNLTHDEIYSTDGTKKIVSFSRIDLHFQNGPIASPADFNGITNEALLTVLIDRMRGFQNGRNPDGSFNYRCPGPYSCRENALTLTHLEEALFWLQSRTRARIARGVEGSNVP